MVKHSIRRWRKAEGHTRGGKAKLLCFATRLLVSPAQQDGSLASAFPPALVWREGWCCGREREGGREGAREGGRERKGERERRERERDVGP